MAGITIRHLMIGTGLAALLAGCGEDGGLRMPFGGGGEAEAAGRAGAVQMVERDVEAPEVFQVNEAGLWDGRPSLGGVWVAHPGTTDPERVIIRNPATDSFVIGALFRRERQNPGPRLQVSSDAAAALGLIAGQPQELNVTALRREEAPVIEPGQAPDTPPATAAAGEVEQTVLADLPIATPAPAPEASSPAAEAAASTTPTPAAPTPAAAPQPRVPEQPSTLSQPFIQIGIFSVKANAEAAADMMRADGMVPAVREESSQGATFWRVVVGPAANAGERAALLGKVKAQGFADAYAVRR